MKKYLFLAAVFLAGGIVSCDRISEDMIEKVGTPVPVDSSLVKANVFLEYFTGHNCGNCPSSSNPAIAEIQRLYGDRVILMTIHAGFFATPSQTPDKLNLTTVDGTRIYTEAGVTGVPVGRVNRRTVGGITLLDPSSWSTAIKSIADERALLALSINSTYDTSTRSGTAVAKIKPYENLNETYSVSTYIVEDSIHGYQLDFTKTPNGIPDYVFNHVLRDELVADGGNAISSTEAGVEVIRTFRFQLNVLWKEKQCSLISIIYNSTTNEVVQVERTPLIIQ